MFYKWGDSRGNLNSVSSQQKLAQGKIFLMLLKL